MSILVDALQPHIARGFFDLRGEAAVTLDDLIGGKSAYYPSFDTASGTWQFDYNVQGPVAEFLAHECSRFGTACFQSYHDVPSALAQQNLIPWACVRAYYAAFYAGHALLRALGGACSYIDGPRVNALRGILRIYSVNAPFAGGLYDVEMSLTGTALQLKSLGQGHGGTHEAFWKLFSARLQALEAAVLKGQMPRNDAQQVALTLARLRAVLTKSGADGSWLSGIRNAIQYRQSMDVWFPGCRVSARERAALSRIASGWRTDPIAVELPTGNTSPPLSAFFSACAFLVACCRALLLRLAQRGRLGRQQSFAYHSALRFLLTHQMLEQHQLTMST